MKTFTKMLIPTVLIASLAACQNQGASDKAAPADAKAKTETKTEAAGGSGSAPTLEMYVMSQCPYGVQVVNAVAPVKEQLGDGLNLKIGYIGSGTAGNFQSLHGPGEVKGDIAQLCATKQSSDKALASPAGSARHAITATRASLSSSSDTGALRVVERGTDHAPGELPGVHALRGAAVGRELHPAERDAATERL